jgi:putative transposase
MNIIKQIRTGRHCVFNLHVHLVFVTKYRRKVFNKAMLGFLQSLFQDICHHFEANLIECEGKQDHVHLLIHYPPKVAISKLVNTLKGVSSRKLRTEFKDIEKNYWKGMLWSPSYFAGSCGGAPITVIRKYIEGQQTPDF